MLRERASKADAAKSLNELRQEHDSIITLYLKQCLSLHGTIPVSGLDASTVSEVACRLYHLSASQQGTLEQNWRFLEIPLEYCPIQLRADESTSFERKAARQMLVSDTLHPFLDLEHVSEQRKTWTSRLLKAPYMPSMIKRDRFKLVDDTEVFEIREVLRRNRWIVILGDPGSGKTTFVRWLVLQYAQAMCDGDRELDFGHARLPILIRIGEFAEAIRENDKLTLFDYIGQHKWLGQSILPSNSMGASAIKLLSKALQDYIRKGQALVILDGLDEISVSEHRTSLVNLVENFVDAYIQTPSFTSVFDDPHLSNLIEAPPHSGGNQLLITSRIVGYHAAPMSGQFTHFIVKPMDIDHMQEFVNFWFRSIHIEIIDRLALIDNQIDINRDTWETHASMLKQELKNEEKEGLRELASNAFLMTFICGVAFGSQEMSLPTQRILLYSQTVNSMISNWNSKGSNINESKLVWILGDIAEYIHDKSSSGLIDEEVLKTICSSSIRSYENIKSPSEDDLKRYDAEAMQFTNIIRDDVGILAARGESLYGFLHLTFQEYFTSLCLVNKTKLKRKHHSTPSNDAQLIARTLHQHIDDPRFRVVIALALGKLSLPQAKDHFDEVCTAFLKESHTSDSFLPLGPLLLISCRNDLSRLPSSHILFDALDQLLRAADDGQWYSRCPKLFSQLVDAVKKLPDSNVIQWIQHVLSRTETREAKPIRALCRLIQCDEDNRVKIDWLDPSVCRLLLDLSRANDKITDFTVDNLLAKIGMQVHYSFPTSSNSLKFFLEQKEIEISNIHPSMLALLITLHGGLKSNEDTVLFDPSSMYRDSSHLTSLLIDYFSDHKASQVDKLNRIEAECDKILLTITPSDESCKAVDSLAAIMCLRGVEKLWTHPHLLKSKALSLALSRLKHVSFFLRQYYSKSMCEEDARQILNNFMERNSLLDTSRTNESNANHFYRMVHVITKALARLRSDLTFHLPDTLSIEESLECLLSPDVTLSSNRQLSSQLPIFVSLFWVFEDDEETETQYRMAVAADTIPKLLLYNNDKDPLYALAFVSDHARVLFLTLLKQKDIVIDHSELSQNTLPYQHILIECLMKLSNSSCKQLSLTFALCGLLPLLRMYNMESFAASLSWTLSNDDDDFLHLFEYTRQRSIDSNTNQYTGGLAGIPNPPTDFVKLSRCDIVSRSLKQEQTRLQDALVLLERSPEDVKANLSLYSASISLAYICWFSQEVHSALLLREALNAASSIHLPLLRFDALCAISLHPRVSSDLLVSKKGRSLRDELEQQLMDICKDLNPLLHTNIVRRCFSVLAKSQAMCEKVADHLTKLLVREDYVTRL